MTIYGRSEELVSRCIECDLAEPESLASLGGSAPGLVDGILSGALKAAKCSYHLLYFDFTSIGILYLRGDHISPTVQIKFNQVTSPTPLQNLTAYTSHKTLVLHKAPAGQSTKQIDILI